MTTKMQMAFVSAPSVTMNTPLGKMILQTAAIQLHAEEQRIRIYAAHKAAKRAQAEENRLLTEHISVAVDQLLPQV